MYATNLSWNKLKGFLRELELKEYIEKVPAEKTKARIENPIPISGQTVWYYKSTEKGLIALAAYRVVRRISDQL